MKLFRHADEILTLDGAHQKQGRFVKEADLGILKNASLLVNGSRILWVGVDRKLPREFAKKKNLTEISCRGLTLLPGLVECHTHSIFSGHRADEFEKRNQGMSYKEIAASGGGILSTVRSTRQASSAKLALLTQKRVHRYVEQGVTTLEIKASYALDERNELKCLKVLRGLKGPRVISSFLGAHAIPPEFKSSQEYLNFLRRNLLPKIKKQKLAERVDIFVEGGFFPRDEAAKYLAAARELGFDVVVHADQMSLSGGTDVAIATHALSADHVIEVGDSEIQALARSEVTAVLLPLADLYMKCKYPPARKMIDAGVRVALATDFNPGTCPSQDLATVGLLARLEMKMTRAEVFSAYTIGAAHALGLQNEVGCIKPGFYADFALFESSFDELFYSVGSLRAASVYRAGKKIF